MQAMTAQMQAAEARRQQEATALQQQRQAMQNPAFLQQLGPMARAMAQLGVDPNVLLSASGQDATERYRQSMLDIQNRQQTRLEQQVAQGGAGRQPTPRQIIEEPLPNGMVQKHILGADGNYKPYGAPYQRFAPGKQAAVDEGEEAPPLIAGHANTPTSPEVDRIVSGAMAPLITRDAQAANKASSLADKIMPPQKEPPLSAAGSTKNAPRSNATDANLQAAAAAIARGADPAAVVQRLKAAGYTAQQIAAAGI
ncbi:hypothetical protein D9M70_488930 [compost metagenome]